MLRCVYTDLVFFIICSLLSLSNSHRETSIGDAIVWQIAGMASVWGFISFFFRSFLKEQSELFGALWAQWRMKVFNIFEIYHAFLCIIFLPFNTVNWWIIIFRNLWQYIHTYICFFTEFGHVYQILNCWTKLKMTEFGKKLPKIGNEIYYCSSYYWNSVKYC